MFSNQYRGMLVKHRSGYEDFAEGIGLMAFPDQYSVAAYQKSFEFKHSQTIIFRSSKRSPRTAQRSATAIAGNRRHHTRSLEQTRRAGLAADVLEVLHRSYTHVKSTLFAFGVTVDLQYHCRVRRFSGRTSISRWSWFKSRWFWRCRGAGCRLRHCAAHDHAQVVADDVTPRRRLPDADRSRLASRAR